MSSSTHYDEKETRSADVREADLFAALAGQLAHAKKNAPYFQNLLADVDPSQITDRNALALLPITRKSDLGDIQKPGQALGGLTAIAEGGLKRIYQSPGPTYDAEGYGDDWWGSARALYASGFRPGDIVHNTFAYHFTPAGSIMETGAHAIGCAVFPAGVGNTELQVRAIADVRPRCYVGTPSFLKIILEKASEMGADISCLEVAAVGGEPFLPAQKDAFEAAHIDAFNVYASADLGCIAYETSARDGLVVEERLIVEIVRPGTGNPVAPGEVGEVVVTMPFNRDYPLIRFATGDMSATLDGVSSCGRTNTRLKGWMGRADQTTKVKGMFVHPRQVAEVVARHDKIAKARLVVTHDEKGQDKMTLQCEVTNSIASSDTAALEIKIAETLQAVCKLKGSAALVDLGSLPNDGKVIEDARALD